MTHNTIDWKIDTNTHIHIATDEEGLRNFMADIVKGQYPMDHTYCNLRNVVELTHCGNRQIVVKKFKRPTLANCVVYTFLRKTKGQRAFDNAHLLTARGFETPKPIAWIERKKNGFFHTGWYVCEYMPRPTMADVWPTLKQEEEITEIVNQGTDFVARLFDSGIIFTDFNAGNILPRRDNDGVWHFALVDINRMKLGKASLRKQMKAIQTMGGDIDLVCRILKRYAALRGLDVFDCLMFFTISRRRFERHRLIKLKLKELIRKNKK